MKSISTLLAASTAFAVVLAETPPVFVRGNAFWTSDNERFFVRGVDYQPGGSSDAQDPIANIEGCRRDVEKFKELGINTIRVYTIDNTANHDECMSLLSDAGIYLALDVNTPLYSINRLNPSKSYNDVYLQSIFATVDKFAGYDNLLLFFSGNEVIDNDLTTNCAPYVKAVTRDLKQYIASRGHRRIPVGYSAADVDSSRFEMAQYMNCGTDDERSDFYAFNDYSWCDPSSYTISGWDKKVELFSNYSLPLFLSEYGCNKNEREWREVASLYSDDMSPVYSGGLVYEYSQEDTDYGLVEIKGDSVDELPDFGKLREALADAPAPEGDGGYRENGQPSECPPRSDTWDVDSELLPAIPEPARAFMENGAGEGPGLEGDGSQEAGVESSGEAEQGSGAVDGEDSGSSAAALHVPAFVAALVVIASTFMGASLL